MLISCTTPAARRPRPASGRDAVLDLIEVEADARPDHLANRFHVLRLELIPVTHPVGVGLPSLVLFLPFAREVHISAGERPLLHFSAVGRPLFLGPRRQNGTRPVSRWVSRGSLDRVEGSAGMDGHNVHQRGIEGLGCIAWEDEHGRVAHDAAEGVFHGVAHCEDRRDSTQQAQFVAIPPHARAAPVHVRLRV